MIVMSQSNSGSGWSAYVFDAQTLHFVAAPSLFSPQSDGNVRYQPPAMGVDPVSGRMVSWSFGVASYGRGGQQGAPCSPRAPGTNSVAIDETAMDGVSVLHFPIASDDFQSAAGSIAYDPVARNWWMLALQSVPPSACDWGSRALGVELVVFHDALPPAVPSPHADVDRSTVDVAEQPGVTGASSSADASAYGARYVVGPSGTDGAMRVGGGSCDLAAKASSTTATSPVPPPAGVPPLPPQDHAFCNADGSTATFAHVDGLSLDSAEARGTAVSGDTDQYTGRDLTTATDVSRPGSYLDAVNGYAGLPPPCAPSATDNEPTGCDEKLAAAQPYLSGLALPYSPASCADGGSGETTTTGEAPLQVHGAPPTTALAYPGAAWVDCSFAEPKVLGHADQVSLNAAGPLGAPVSAFAESSDAQVGRTLARGSVAAATATVTDIAVGSFLHIASLTASASVQAHGRPTTNVPSYTCEVQGVSVTLPTGVALPPGVPTSIGHAQCGDGNLQALVAALNTLLGTKVHISFPTPFAAADHPAGGDSAVVRRQSPRGFLSEVAISDLDLAQNTILVNDTSIEQPAMVVTWYLDNANARNRLVASFAGVAATARYGIYLLDDSGGDGGSDFADAIPGQAETGVVPLPVAPPIEGGPPPAAGVAAAPSAPPTTSAGWGAVPGAVVDGVRFLLQHPAVIPPLLAVWLLFTGPGYILARRRALLRATLA